VFLAHPVLPVGIYSSAFQFSVCVPREACQLTSRFHASDILDAAIRIRSTDTQHVPIASVLPTNTEPMLHVMQKEHLEKTTARVYYK
jgi:hypothetical protein